MKQVKKDPAIKLLIELEKELRYYTVNFYDKQSDLTAIKGRKVRDRIVTFLEEVLDERKEEN